MQLKWNSFIKAYTHIISWFISKEEKVQPNNNIKDIDCENIYMISNLLN